MLCHMLKARGEREELFSLFKLVKEKAETAVDIVLGVFFGLQFW